MKKLITDKILYVLASLFILTVVGMLNLKARVEAVEIDNRYNKEEHREMLTNILAIRCAVTKEHLVCLEFEAKK